MNENERGRFLGLIADALFTVVENESDLEDFRKVVERRRKEVAEAKKRRTNNDKTNYTINKNV